MRDRFHGYFKPTTEEFKALWADCLFAFDANILLNLYRYSGPTKDEFIKVITSLNDRIWLPYQAAEEYFTNRINTTEAQIKEYKKVEEKIDELLEDLDNNKRHPFINAKLLLEFKNVIVNIKTDFQSNKDQLSKRLQSDEILEILSNLFTNNIGEEFSDKDLNVIYEEGKKRYENKVPPGFRDKDKDKGSNLYRKFGDLIIWKELIRKSKTESKNIIFITDDKKDDWWLMMSDGKTIGPQPTLLQEFTKETGCMFYMYTADRFLKSANEFLNTPIEATAIEELKEFREEETLNTNSQDQFLQSVDDIHTLHFLYVSDEAKEEIQQADSKTFYRKYLTDMRFKSNVKFVSIDVLNLLNEYTRAYGLVSYDLFIKYLISVGYTKELADNLLRALELQKKIEYYHYPSEVGIKQGIKLINTNS